jgi:hypothetical protein
VYSVPTRTRGAWVPSPSSVLEAGEWALSIKSNSSRQSPLLVYWLVFNTFMKTLLHWKKARWMRAQELLISTRTLVMAVSLVPKESPPSSQTAGLMQVCCVSRCILNPSPVLAFFTKITRVANSFPHFAYRLNKRAGMCCTPAFLGCTLWSAGCHEPLDATVIHEEPQKMML